MEWNSNLSAAPNGVEVLVSTATGNTSLGYRDAESKCWRFSDAGRAAITHWAAKPNAAHCQFFVGSHNASWIYSQQLGWEHIPIFVARQRMPKAKREPAVRDWALDSGAFTELQMHGHWRMGAEEYAHLVLDYSERIGRLVWAAPQDWMCEDAVISGGRFGGIEFVGTGLSVKEHQEKTVQNYLDLRALNAPVIPVLQGYTEDEYHHCIDLYESAGVDLPAQKVVGVGSVCRRKNLPEARRILRSIANRKIAPHGFGLAREAVEALRDVLASADSLAWSLAARHSPPSCDRGVKNCANCWHAARDWWRLVSEPRGKLPALQN